MSEVKKIGSRLYEPCPECVGRYKRVGAPRCNHCAATVRSRKRADAAQLAQVTRDGFGVPVLPQNGSERDWPEDASHENGKYQCQCIYCAEYFFGHKRRFVCKLCAAKPGETVASLQPPINSKPCA